jgi:hypothetical protein
MKVILTILAVLLIAPMARASDWYIPMVDSEPGGFDHIQLLMAPGYRFASPAMTAFAGPDAEGNPSASAEQWSQMFLNDKGDFAYATGPADGYEFLAFSIWIEGNRQVDRPSFHYQTYLGDSLVGNYDLVCVGPGELDWLVLAGTWSASRPIPPFLPGDADLDTDVDIHDFAIWQQNYTGPGATGMEWIQGNWDGDGDVDIHDFSLWQQNYTGPHAPEPATAAMLVLGGLGLMSRRRRASR